MSHGGKAGFLLLQQRWRRLPLLHAAAVFALLCTGGKTRVTMSGMLPCPAPSAGSAGLCTRGHAMPRVVRWSWDACHDGPAWAHGFEAVPLGHGRGTHSLCDGVAGEQDWDDHFLSTHLATVINFG